jgi:hypothetical protein
VKPRHLTLAALAIIFGTSACATERHGVGLNKFDLVKQYTGYASGGDASHRYLKVTQAMGRKAILDARDANVGYLRVSATGFSPSDLQMWREEPSRYWARIDELMDDLDKAGVKGIFTFIWNTDQFPLMTGETAHDLLSNPDSRSYRAAESYIAQFVERYRHRRTILFYELTNEMNLGADLDTVSRCHKEEGKASCAAKANYTTAEMIQFTRRLAALIRGLDPARPISSGFAVPRPSAEHLRARPEWRTGKADFTPDTLQQFQRHLGDIHQDLDLISVHLYPTEANRRFGTSDRRSTQLLEIVKQAADNIGKPLFIGEFGDSERLDGTADSYTVRALDRIVALDIPYSAVWAWQFYQKTPYTTRDNQHTAYSLEPGITDAAIYAIARTNERMGKRVPARSLPDRIPPRVVLTWPLECSTLRDLQNLYAVASDDSGAMGAVEFWLDDRLQTSDFTPPYEATLATSGIARGEHTIKVKAIDQAGNSAEYLTIIRVGKQGPGSACSQGLER